MWLLRFIAVLANNSKKRKGGSMVINSVKDVYSYTIQNIFYLERRKCIFLK